jgi:hypothetical protein
VRFLYTPVAVLSTGPFLVEDDLVPQGRASRPTRLSLQTAWGRQGTRRAKMDRGREAVQGVPSVSGLHGAGFGLGSTRGVDVTQVRGYVPTLAPS